MEFLVEATVVETDKKCSVCKKRLNKGEKIYLEVSEVIGLVSHGFEFYDDFYCKDCGGNILAQKQEDMDDENP